MSSFDYLVNGFGTALSWQGLLYCFIGCLWGTIVGVLPGLGPLAGMTLLLPLTFGLDPTTGIIMLTGIFYGSMYGGSTTSILVRIPGEAASVVTCIDGHEMARQGRAGPALMVAAVGSFIGGSVSILGLIFIAPPLAKLMIQIGPSVEVMLILFALVVISLVSAGSRIKTAAMISLGLLLGTVGMDKLTGFPRFTFGSLGISDGLSFAALAIGLFGVSEILTNLEKTDTIKAITPKFRDLIPRAKDLRESFPAIARGSVIGSIFGIIPGVSHIVSTFVSYAVEKKLSRHPEQFGKGAIAGVAGPETANNAVTGTAMIPLLALGIPSIPATAILLSALTIHGVQPGPLLLTENPQVFWGLIASMYIGNVILLILNLPLVSIFVNLLRIPYVYLVPIILVISVVGVYSVDFNAFDIWVMVISGFAGYFLRKFGYEMAPLLLALVLGDRLEENFRLSLTMSGGHYSTFVDNASLIVLGGSISLLLAVQGIAWAFGYRKTFADEAEGA
ncbi:MULTISPECIES: tripartite tricarboxylate transporter permease [Rhodomicrobium]|uniref:tripartite tricarboxylate transporter permease n=1 Tax=Rhodomicrobium TaxID=1068 RepID=UPI000B4C2085|nr:MULTISPECIES: tripartite tricarboxylate transporter permease [Rhodomicrobium]